MYACAIAVAGGSYLLEWESGAANVKAVRVRGTSTVITAGLRDY